MRAGQPRIRRLRPNGALLSVAAKWLTSGGYVFHLPGRDQRGPGAGESNGRPKPRWWRGNSPNTRDTDTGVRPACKARLVGQTARIDGRWAISSQRGNLHLSRPRPASCDVGKIATPDSILLKPGPLSDAGACSDDAAQRQRALNFFDKPNSLWEGRYLNMGADISATHHEWFDGNGYPKGLCGWGHSPGRPYLRYC